MRNILRSTFLKSYLKIFKTGAFKSKRKLFLIFIFDTLSFASQGGVIFTLALIIQQINNDTASSDGISTHIINSIQFLLGYLGGASAMTLLGVGILISTTLSITAVSFRYRAATIARSLARQLHISLIKQNLDLNLSKKNLFQLSLSENPEEVPKGALQHSLHTGNSLEILVRIPQIIFYFFVLLSTALFINVYTTIFLLFLILISLPFSINLSKKIHSSSSTFFNYSSSKFGEKVLSLIERYNNCYSKNFPQRSASSELTEWEETKDYFNTFDKIQLANAQMAFRTGMIKSIIFSSGLIMISYWIISTNSPIYTIITYAGSLFMAFGYLQMFFSYMVSLNLFYPQVNRQLTLIKQEQNPNNISSTCSFSIKGMSVNSQLEESIILHKGNAVDFILSFPNQRLNSPLWLAPLNRVSNPPITLNKIGLIKTSASINIDDINYLMLNNLNYDSYFNNLLKITSSEEIFKQEAMNPKHSIVSPILSAIAKIIFAATSEEELIFIEQNMLTMFSDNIKKHILSLFENKHLFLSRIYNEDTIGESFIRKSILIKNNNVFIDNSPQKQFLQEFFEEDRNNSLNNRGHSQNDTVITL